MSSASPLLIVLIFFLYGATARVTPTSAADKSAPSLYIFAHQDDELLIMAKMREEIKKGIKVYCIWTTNGGKSAPPEIREKESRKAMELTGVPDKNLYFLGYEDQESHKYLKEIIDRVVEIIKKIKPERIYANTLEGGNIDHDIVNFVAVQAAKQSKLKIKLYEFPLYNFHGNKFRVNEFIPDEHLKIFYTPLNEELIKFKERLFEVYESQKRANLLMRKFFFNEKKAKEKGEPYRAMPKNRDFLKSPHSGKLLYELGLDRRTLHSFEDFKEKVKEYLEGTK